MILQILLYCIWFVAIFTVEMYIAVVNYTDMFVKASFLSKWFAANLTLMCFHFSSNHYDVGFEIFYWNTEITLLIFCFFDLLSKNLSLLTKESKTQLNISVDVEKHASFYFNKNTMFVGSFNNHKLTWKGVSFKYKI